MVVTSFSIYSHGPVFYFNGHGPAGEGMSVELSIIFPAYNEGPVIHRNLLQVIKKLDERRLNYEIIVVDDGSTDDTLAQARLLEDARLKVLASKPNRGKGYAINVGMHQAQGQYRLFMDVDLSTSLDEIEKFLRVIRQGQSDMVIGYRNLRQGQPWYRAFLGRVFRGLSGMLICGDFPDFTCGFKMFTASASEKIFLHQKIYDWVFDSEILFLAKRYHLKVSQLPVQWQHEGNSKVRLGSVVDEFFNQPFENPLVCVQRILSPMIQSPKIVRVNTAWAVALVMAVGLQLLLVMAVIASWMPAVYGSEVADIFPRGRTSFRQKYDLQIYHALILATFGLTFATAFIFKDRMSKEGWLRPLQRFVVMTLLWSALAYWSAFELIVHPATGVFKIVFSIAIAGNWLTWGMWLINPRWWLPLDSFIFTALAAFRKNVWVEKIIELGAQRALTERIALSICAVILVITHQAWLGPVSLPYWWPLRFTYVGLYTLSFALPIFYLMVTLIAMESLGRRASGYGRWCRSLGIAGLISFLVYVRAPIPVIPWLSLWPLIVLSVLALWKAASSGHGVWVMGIWKSVNVRVWVAVLGGIELGLICPWIHEQAKFPVSPSDFSTIVYFAFIAGAFAVYGLLPLVRTYEKLASFAVLQAVLVSLTSMAWFKLVVYDYRADLARFWFHWLGILILLQVFVWFALRWFISWGKPGLQGIDAKYRSLITWIIILGLIFGATFIPNIEAMTAHIFMGEYNVHSDTYIMGPAWALAHGAVIDVDVYSRYGIGSVHFLVRADEHDRRAFLPAHVHHCCLDLYLVLSPGLRSLPPMAR